MPNSSTDLQSGACSDPGRVTWVVVRCAAQVVTLVVTTLVVWILVVGTAVVVLRVARAVVTMVVMVSVAPVGTTTRSRFVREAGSFG